MKLNPFNNASPFFAFRWYIMLTLALSSVLAYANLTGLRIFSGGQEQWNASGPGGHK